MERQIRFYLCKDCDSLVELVEGAGAPLTCCGKAMEEITAGASDGAAEKHVPVAECRGNEVLVKVGSAPHPMTVEHSITWVELITEKGCQRQYLCPTLPPEAHFILAPGDKPLAVYAYCNLHSLWMAKI